jgi:ribonuclease P protein component
MLSRDRRLKKADFEIAFAKGKQFRHPLLVLRCYCRAADDASHQPRAAFVVPKKLAQATGRNRWRRRLRHWFYEILQESLPALEQENYSKWNQCDFIFMLTAQGHDATPREVRQAMRMLWRKVLHSPGRNEYSCV